MKKVLISTCWSLAFALSATVVFGQSGRISGHVMSKGEPLPFANVWIKSHDRGATTDELGDFRFTDLEAGTYLIQISFVGLQGHLEEVLLSDGEEKNLIISLDDAARLEEIVVTGTMKPTYVSDSPIKVDVISARLLETFIPTAASSVVEGIQLVNGVQEVVACGVCFTNTISVNGLEGAYTAILMDGTPMFGNLASVYGLNGIPTMIIDRFEVIKGPSSTLYGSEAVAGVINIITKDPSEQPILAVDIMGTTHKESFGNLALAPKIGKSHGYIGWNYAYINDFEDHNEDGFGDNISLDRHSIFTKWKIHRKDNKRFDLAAKYYYEDRRNGVKEFLQERAYRHLRGSSSIYGESIYTRRLEVFGTYDLPGAGRTKLDFSVSDHQQDSYYGSDFYKADQQILFGNLTHNLVSDRHDVIIGASARINAYDDNTVATETIDQGRTVNRPDNQFIPGLFVQDEFKINEQLTLLGGARIDHYSKHGFIASPRLSAKYKAGDWTTFRLNFGTGFRTVHLFTEDHAFITGQRQVELAEELLPERSVNTSFNLNHVFSLGNGTGSVDIESYYTHFSNKIIPDYDTPGKILYANSSGYARTQGIGINVNYSMAFPLGLMTGFNTQRVTETDIDTDGTKVTRKVEFAPEWSALISANYEWKGTGLLLAYTARFTGPMSLPEVYDLDENGFQISTPRSTRSTPYAIHNIQISRKMKSNFSLYGGVQNLFNFKQALSPLTGYNDPNAAVGFSNFFDTSYAYAPIHGVEWYLGFKWDLQRSVDPAR